MCIWHAVWGKLSPKIATHNCQFLLSGGYMVPLNPFEIFQLVEKGVKTGGYGGSVDMCASLVS